MKDAGNKISSGKDYHVGGGALISIEHLTAAYTLRPN
jgi:hypothetical protein